jgi:hypothetical protein
MKGGWGTATLAYGLKLADASNVDIWDANTITSYGFETTANRFKGVGQFKFGGNMGLNTEFDYIWGEKDFTNNIKKDLDISQLAFIADFNATFDAFTGHAMYFYTSGDDNAKDTDLENYYGTGADFEPLYILTGVFGNILNNDQTSAVGSFGDAAKKAGSNAFILTGDFAASQDLTLHAGFGYAMADKEMAGYDDEYGFEYNAGVAYKLVDNLVYAVHLGYLDTGDFFKMGTKYKDTNAIFLASHHLTMSF